MQKQFKAIIVLLISILLMCVSVFADTQAYSLSSISGTTISTTPSAPKKCNVLIFGRPTCLNTRRTLKEISISDLIQDSRVGFIYADIDGNSKEAISDFAALFNQNIIFCYGDNSAVAWDLYGTYGSVALPFVFVIDSSGELVYTGTGYHIIKGKGLYTGTKKAFFNILPAEIEEAELTVKKNFVYTGAAIRPAIIVDFDGSVLTAGEDFNTKFSNNINVGTATVVVQGIGNFTGEKKGSFTILPKGTALKSLKAGSKKITATWSKQAVTGYQIEYSTDKKMLSGTKRKTVSSGKTTSLTISGLKAGTRYYVRIRTYKKISGKSYYSAWSKVKNVVVGK